MNDQKYKEDLIRLVGLDKPSKPLPPQEPKSDIECTRGVGTMSGNSYSGTRDVPPTVDDDDDGSGGGGGGGGGGGECDPATDPDCPGYVCDPATDPNCPGYRDPDVCSGNRYLIIGPYGWECRCPPNTTWKNNECVATLGEPDPPPSCEPGWTYNINLGQCQNPETGETGDPLGDDGVNCDAGYTYNQSQGLCVNNSDPNDTRAPNNRVGGHSGINCPTGYTWNQTTRLCHNDGNDNIRKPPEDPRSPFNGGSGITQGTSGITGLYDCTTGEAVTIYIDPPEGSTDENGAPQTTSAPLPVHECNCRLECVTYGEDETYVAGTWVAVQVGTLYPTETRAYSLGDLPPPATPWGEPTPLNGTDYFIYSFPFIQGTWNADTNASVISHRQWYRNDELLSEGDVFIGTAWGCNNNNASPYCDTPYNGICVEEEVCDQYPWKAHDCYQPAEGCVDDPLNVEGKFWALSQFNTGSGSPRDQFFYNDLVTTADSRSQSALINVVYLNDLGQTVRHTGGSYWTTSGIENAVEIYHSYGSTDIQVGKKLIGGNIEYLFQYDCSQNPSNPGCVNPSDPVQVCAVEEQCCPPKCEEDGYTEGTYWKADGNASFQFSTFYGASREAAYNAAPSQIYSEFYGIWLNYKFPYMQDFNGDPVGTDTSLPIWYSRYPGDAIRNSVSVTRLGCPASPDETLAPYCNDPYGEDTENCHWQADRERTYNWSPTDGLTASPLEPDAKVADTEAAQPVFCAPNGDKVKLLRGADGSLILHRAYDQPVDQQVYTRRDPVTGRFQAVDNTQINDWLIGS